MAVLPFFWANRPRAPLCAVSLQALFSIFNTNIDMKNSTRLLLPFFCLLGLFAATLSAQIPHLVFHAELSGSEEIPAVNSNGKALVSLLYTPDRTKAAVSGMFVNLSSDVTEFKIFAGKTGETGPLLLDLSPMLRERHLRETVDVPPALLGYLLRDEAYAQIRTTAHPSGEIRGQFFCETDQDFSALLTGDGVTPPTGSNAIAFGGLHFPLGSFDLVYAFTIRGLSSPMTQAAIYEGSPDDPNNLLSVMTGFGGGIVQGLIELDTIDPDFLRKAREGKYTVVIKTVNFPQGEIQGPLGHIGYFASLAPINGLQQVPQPIPPSAGFGFSSTTPNGTLDALTTTAFINTILPTSVKVHIGNPGQVGPELVTLDATAIPGLYSKTYPITEAQLTDFAQGRMYINVTTNAFPNGEIRGAMKNTLRKGYAFDLCGIQAVPPTNSSALGIAVASVDQANCYLNYKIIVDGLSGAPIDGYFAEGTVGTNGIAFHATPNTAPIMASSHEILAALGPIIEASGSYVNISTTAHLSGEIRGQVRRGYSCPEIVPVTVVDHLHNVTVSPVPFRDVLNVELASAEAFEGRLVLHDMMGVQTISQTVQVVAGAQTLSLQTSYLPKGTYTLSLEVPGQNTAVLLKKVIRAE